MPATAIGLNFSGGNGSSFAPPDTDGAIGPSDYVQFINGRFAVYDSTTGIQILAKTDTAFWNAAGMGAVTGVGLSDTRIIYDPLSDRWFATEINVSNTGNQVLVGRSDTNDPAGSWKAVNFTGDSGFADYPTLGVDANAIVVGTINFTSSVGAFKGSSVFTIPKADILLAAPTAANRSSVVQVSGTPALGIIPQGVTNFAAAPTHTSILAVNSSGFGKVNLTTATGTGAAGATFSPTSVLTVANTSYPGLSQQPDGTQDLDSSDDRFSGMVYQIGDLIFGVHGLSVNSSGVAATASGSTTNAIRVTVLRDSTGALVTEATYFNTNFDYSYPSISINQFGNIIIGFSRSSPNAGSGATDGNIGAYAVEASIDLNNPTAGITFVGSDIQLKAGQVNNYHLFGGPGERWGDFSATSVDPNNPVSFWTTQEYAVGAGTWGTRISQIFVSPEVTGVTSTVANGTYGTGAVIPITVTFNDAVTVTGVPQLTLNSGATVNYSSGSGTNTLTFNYTVGAGETSADLDYTSTSALSLNGGTIKDSLSNLDAILTLPAPAAAGSLGGNKDIVIVTTGAVASVTSTTPNGTYGLGATINVTVNFTQPVTLSGGNLTVNLDTGGSVTITPFTNQLSVSGTYIVGPGENSPDLNSISPLILQSGATLRDAGNNNTVLTIPSGQSLADLKDIVIDTPGTITSVTSTTADGLYGVGATINVTVNFSEPVTLAGGTLTVTLDTGATVTFAAFTGQTSVSGTYTVAAGQNSADLNSLSPLLLSSGATLKDGSGNDVVLTIPTGESLADLDDIVIDTSAPTVTISAPSAPVTAGGPITYTITYTDANFATSSLHASDVTLISTGTATGDVSVSEGNGSTRIVIISNITGDGTLSITIAAGTAVDAAGNQAPGAGPSAPFDVDNTGPSVSISEPSNATATTGPVTYTITYADPHFNVSTLTEADITLNKTGTANGTVSVSPGNGATRTVTISNITGDGRLSITIAANTANDTVGNEAGPAGPSRVFTVSNTPFMAIGSSVGNVRLINGRTGQVFASFRPLDIEGGSKYTGVVEVALGDISGDGLPDVFVSAADPVGVDGLTGTKASKVFVYDGATLAQGKIPTAFRQFTPFTDHNGPGENGSMISKNGTYVNGVNIAVGDVNGDGIIDLIAGSRGGSEAGGSDEYGRLVVIDGASAPGSDKIIGSILTPFGETYQKGVVVAAGDMDGDGAAEIAVTRGGPVAASNTNKTVKLKALKLTDGVLTELPLSGNSFPLAPFAGITGANGEVLARDARVTFVDQNGDGKDELVISILDGITDPTNTQVRIATFSINSVTGVATPISAGTGPSNSYLVGDHVVNQAITQTDVSGDGSTDLALILENDNSGIHYLNPRTGRALSPSLTLPLSTGGIAIDGI